MARAVAVAAAAAVAAAVAAVVVLALGWSLPVDHPAPEGPWLQQVVIFFLIWLLYLSTQGSSAGDLGND